MVLTQEKGGYARGQVVRLHGSFRINGTSDPDDIRDGNSSCVASVARVSAGLFTVTFDAGFPIPEKLVSWRADVSQVAAPTSACRAHLIVDSYSQSSRSFQIQCLDFETPSVVDPDDNDQVSFELVGSVSSVGTD